MHSIISPLEVPPARRRPLGAAPSLVLIATLFIAACTESLESTAGCPILCPNQSLTAREVVLDAIEYDATVEGFPPLGTSGYFTLAYSGDTLDSRMVVRFDSLPDSYTLGGTEFPVTDVDSAHLRLFLDVGTSRVSANVRLELYDVDTAAADDDMEAVKALFRLDRLLGTRTITPAELQDTLDLPVANFILAAKIQHPDRRLRIGVRVVSDSTARISVISANQTRFPRLRYDPAPESPDYNVFERVPRSFTPLDDPRVAVNYTDYRLVVSGPFPLRPSGTGADTAGLKRDSILAVGGVAGRRAYFRFEVPDSVLNSSIVRATLILQKRPTPRYGLSDTLAIVPQAVFATAAVPVTRAAFVTDTLRRFPMQSVRMSPNAAGEIRFDVISYVRNWTVASRSEVPPAIVLRTGLEDRAVHEMHFYSTWAAPELRPRLRLTFIPRQEIGLP